MLGSEKEIFTFEEKEGLGGLRMKTRCSSTRYLVNHLLQEELFFFSLF